MTEEEKIFAGKLYCPADPDLRARKLRAHNLCTRYNAAFEDDAAQRSEILRALFASLGADSFLQGPIYIHYGLPHDHRRALLRQLQPDRAGRRARRHRGRLLLRPRRDDRHAAAPAAPRRAQAAQTAGRQRKARLLRQAGENRQQLLVRRERDGLPGRDNRRQLRHRRGSVVTRDIPPDSLAAGVPCRVLRAITEADRMANRPELF